jgi:hypothetical protein
MRIGDAPCERIPMRRKKLLLRWHEPQLAHWLEPHEFRVGPHEFWQVGAFDPPLGEFLAVRAPWPCFRNPLSVTRLLASYVHACGAV